MSCHRKPWCYDIWCHDIIANTTSTPWPTIEGQIAYVMKRHDTTGVLRGRWCQQETLQIRHDDVTMLRHNIVMLRCHAATPSRWHRCDVITRHSATLRKQHRRDAVCNDMTTSRHDDIKWGRHDDMTSWHMTLTIRSPHSRRF